MARKSAVRVGINSLEVGREKRFNDLGILMSRGNAWRATHNAWHPFFTKDSLAGYTALMTKARAVRLCFPRASLHLLCTVPCSLSSPEDT